MSSFWRSIIQSWNVVKLIRKNLLATTSCVKGRTALVAIGQLEFMPTDVSIISFAFLLAYFCNTISFFHSLHTLHLLCYNCLWCHVCCFSLSDIINVSILCPPTHAFLASGCLLVPVATAGRRDEGAAALVLFLMLCSVSCVLILVPYLLPVFVVWCGSRLCLHDTYNPPVKSWDALLVVLWVRSFTSPVQVRWIHKSPLLLDSVTVYTDFWANTVDHHFYHCSSYFPAKIGTNRSSWWEFMFAPTPPSNIFTDNEVKELAVACGKNWIYFYVFF